MRLRLLLSLVAFACALCAGAVAQAAPAPSVVRGAIAERDPLAFSPAQLPALQQSATFGHSHVLYARSPAGALATARRTAAWRPLIERAVAGSGFSADTLEAIVFLESAGRPDAIAGGDAHAASGLVQIMGETAKGFLGMDVDLEASGRLTKRIAAARARGGEAAARRLEARRRAVDPRFDPPKALAASVRYLEAARGYLGRNDLAVVSYHMGIGNLQNVMRAYAGRADAAVPYTQIYFDADPDRHPQTWALLSSLNDDSRHYYFKVLAARRIMHLFRTNPRRLSQLAALHTRKSSHEEVLHPPSATKVYRRPADLAVALRRGELVPLPNRPGALHFEVSPKMGTHAREVGAQARLYRALRPEALATLAYIAQRVQQVGGTTTPIVVTSTVRDRRYQQELAKSNPNATRRYSTHTTGWAFDLSRSWNSKRQAAAVQFVLDRLVARGLIAYIKERDAIHVTVAPNARVLVPVMLSR